MSANAASPNRCTCAQMRTRCRSDSVNEAEVVELELEADEVEEVELDAEDGAFNAEDDEVVARRRIESATARMRASD